MWSYFKFKKEDRTMVQEPKDAKAWSVHLISELIGTIWISLGLAGLSIYIDGKALESYFLLNNIFVGFFAGFIIVGSCLVIFGRWSADLNPAVSIYRFINGTNTFAYMIAKVIMQMLGGIIAGLIVYGIGIASNGVELGNAANASISAIASANKDFLESNNEGVSALVGGSLWIFFGEMIMTAILLFGIFSPLFEGKFRDVMVVFVISMSVWMGIFIGSAAINPARGLAQQVPDLFFGLKSGDAGSLKTNKLGFASISLAHGLSHNDALIDLICATVMMTLGGLLAPFFYAFMQGFNEKYFAVFFNKMIQFKNNKADHLITKSPIKEEEKESIKNKYFDEENK